MQRSATLQATVDLEVLLLMGGKEALPLHAWCDVITGADKEM